MVAIQAIPTIPPMLDAIPSAWNSNFEIAEKHTREWCRTHSLLSSEDDHKIYDMQLICDLSARVYPSASAEDLCLLNDFMSWAFHWDDIVDGSGGECSADQIEERLARMDSVVFGGVDRADADAFDNSFLEIWSRMRRKTTGAWQRRFHYDFLEYTWAITYEANLRTQDNTIPIRNLLETKRIIGGCMPTIDVYDIALGVNIPLALYYCCEFKAMVTASADISTFTNDLFFPEYDASGKRANVVLSFEQENGGDREAAVERTKALIDDRLRDFFHAERMLPDALRRIARASENITDDDIENSLKWAAATRDWMRGCWDWYATSRRYTERRPI